MMKEDTIIEAPFNTASISLHPAFDNSAKWEVKWKVLCVLCAGWIPG